MTDTLETRYVEFVNLRALARIEAVLAALVQSVNAETIADRYKYAQEANSIMGLR